MTYIAIPLTDKSAVLKAIYSLIPEGTIDFPLDLDKELDNPELEVTRLRLKAIRDEMNSLLFRFLGDSDHRLGEVILQELGVWVRLEKWKNSANAKFNGWIVTAIRKIEDFGDLAVADVRVERRDDNAKVVKFTVGGYGAEGYNVDYLDFFEEVLTNEGRLPHSLDSKLLGHYPPTVIDLIHNQITLGSLAA